MRQDPRLGLRGASPLDSLFGRLGRRAGLAFRGGALTVCGFGAITYAGFQWDPIAGWIVAGVSLFAMDWLREKPPSDKPVPR